MSDEDTKMRPLAQRVAELDWPRITTDLDTDGWSVVDGLLAPGECQELTRLYEQPAVFRSRIVMARHNFGKGEYQYFSYPLPATIRALRQSFYAQLQGIANRWNTALRIEQRYPPSLDELVEVCRAAGQHRPTPLLLRYAAGDYNCLHQDLYGEIVFPLQVAVLLAEPGRDFTGGEFVLAEQRPRMQSRVSVVPLKQGGAVIFAVRERPIHGTRGYYKVALRHGVSRLRSGARHTLGIIFHDAS